MLRTAILGILIACGLSSASAAVAGECNCKSEIGNAYAIMSGECGKIWSNGRCTLKEVGLGQQSSLWRQDTLATAGIGEVEVFTTERYTAALSQGEIANALQSATLDLLQEIADQKFAGGAVRLIGDNQDEVQKGWFSADQPVVLQNDFARGAVRDYCFYAESLVSAENFYLSAHPDQIECAAVEALK